MTASFQSPIAIVGLGCLFPKGNDLKSYWRLLFEGTDAISDVPDTHWSPSDYFSEDPKTPDHVYCRRGGFLSPIDFDPTQFGIPPALLESTDTAQLLALVAAQAALKDAGYLDAEDRSRVSVILGATGTQELAIPLGARLGHPHWRRALLSSGVAPEISEEVIRKIGDAYLPWQETSFPGLLGNVIAGRICNRLDLGGTNCVVDAACGSSLGAVHLALMELATNKSDMVLTGGVDMLNDIFMHMCFSRTGVLSHTQDIRPFSKDADGTLLGEGVGILAMKRLADAEKDNDRIYAVIRGMGTSSDGKSQSIYAPRKEGQEKALRAAYDEAGFSPATVSHIEAHGTGTRVGDQVEFQALKQVFSEVGAPARGCALGSVKSMIGHTKAAAGSAGLIKTALALYHKVLPPTLKAGKPDPNLGIDESPFYLSGEARPWISAPDHPRRAGVSAFGFGGSNFHAVLEEYHPKKTDPAWDGAVEILAFSGPSEAALITALDAFKTAVDQDRDALPWLAAESRKRFSVEDEHRLLLVVDRGHLEGAAIDSLLPDVRIRLTDPGAGTLNDLPHVFYGKGPKAGKLAFLFPGQGSQHVNMGRELACVFPEVFEVIEKAEGLCRKAGDPLARHIYPSPAADLTEKRHQESTLRQTNVAQPAIGAVSLGMAHLLARFGIVPDACCGHSFGELTALCAAGWLREEDFLSLAIRRGKCMADAGAQNGAGGMMAVLGNLALLEEKLKEAGLPLILANRNSPSQGVLSGPVSAFDEAEALCKAWGFSTARLPVSGAFHSSMMDQARAPFTKLLAKTAVTPTPCGVYANVSGKAYPADSKQIKTLLSDQLVSPVDFIGNLTSLYGDGVRTLVEVGPKAILTSLARETLPPDVSLFSMKGSHGKDTASGGLAALLCRLAALGHAVLLDRWEEPAEKPVQKRMHIPLSGANARPKPAADARPLPRETAPADVPAQPKEILSVSIPPYRERVTAMSSQTPSDAMLRALKVAEQGLSTMQSLQLQTAQAHQKFLETQAEAAKALQEMIAAARGLASPGQPRAVMQTVSAAPVLARAELPAAPLVAVPPAPKPQAPAPLPQVAPPKNDAVSHTLLAIVGKLTGYPEDMLGLEMDIESDLGIDSIKRVEILSAMDEAMPGLPAVAPDMMGSLKTLGHIVAYLSAGTAASASTPSPVSSAPASANGKIRETLLGIVSKLTGYPEDMLGLDMDIESDLGIDSIKRVEILSAMDEAMPGLPAVAPDMMGSLKTLGQIVAHLAAGTSAPAATPSAPPAPSTPGAATQNITATLLGIVSKLTGYPEDMLGLDMDIESDLGIDSIKRVEILSAMDEAVPGLPPVLPEMMGSLKTLGLIVDHLSQHTKRDLPSKSPEMVGNITDGVSNTSADQIRTTLLGVVSRLTGYPEDMLGLDMDIESDLGIDSIKRVEILSAMDEAVPGLPPVLPEMMGNLKTLGLIIAHLSGDAGCDAQQSSIPAPSTDPKEEEKRQPIERMTISPVASSYPEPSKDTRSITGTVYVTDDGTPLGQDIVDALAAKGVQGKRIPWELAEEIRAGKLVLSDAAGLVLIPPLAIFSADGSSPKDLDVLKDAFLFTKHVAPMLTATASGALFGSVTRLDGAFGFFGKGVSKPAAGGLAGLVKTAAIEWEKVRCRAFDIAPTWEDNKAIAQRIVSELLAADLNDAVEVGLTKDNRVTLCLSSSPASEEGATISDLKAGDVVVVSGGARGVTAGIAKALAEAVRPTLILLGRSPEPTAEPGWLQGISSPREMKSAIIENEFKGKKPTPKAVEGSYRRYEAGREIVSTLAAIRESGAKAAYISTDIRDEKSLSDVLNTVRTEYGPIKAVLHGAGVLEDRLIADKTEAQFTAVLETKIKGLQALLSATAEDPVKMIVLFSSVAARFGNQGQADYATANEVLNKIAQQQAASRKDRKIISVNWGPWNGGMVTEALKQEFSRRNIPLIPMDAGPKYLINEMALASPPAEVIIGAPLQTVPAENHDATAPSSLRMMHSRDVSVIRFPVLTAHQLDRIPVVPFALLTEWIGHTALHENPGLLLHGIEDMRLLKGIRMDVPEKRIRLLAGKSIKKGKLFEVNVEIRNGVPNAREILHSKAMAVLVDRLPAAPEYDDTFLNALTPYPKSVQDVYKNILFHGEALKGIQKILGLSDKGMAAEVSPAPAPGSWIVSPLRSKWIADPLALDSAFQMACVWCYENMGMVSLPSFVSSYRQYCRKFPETPMTAVLEVTGVTSHKMTADITFLDADGKVSAKLHGYEAVMDGSLFKAFKPQLSVAMK